MGRVLITWQYINLEEPGHVERRLGHEESRESKPGKHKAMKRRISERRVEQALDAGLQETFPSVTEPTGPRQPASGRPRRKRA